jgi:hypothetical protein
VDAVLFSHHFHYFGRTAPKIPASIRKALYERNPRNYYAYDAPEADALIAWVENNFALNTVLGDPFDFEDAQARYSAETNKVTR